MLCFVKTSGSSVYTPDGCLREPDWGNAPLARRVSKKNLSLHEFLQTLSQGDPSRDCLSLVGKVLEVHAWRKLDLL